jgi:hypothetical protein
MITSKRVFYLMIAALGILVLAIVGSAYTANTMLEKRAKTLGDLKLQNQVLEQEKVGLVKAKKDVAKYSELEKIAKTIVPQDKDQAEVVREIVKLAADSGFKPSSITLPASTLGTVKSATPATGAPAASAATSNLTQLKPVKGNPGLYVLEISVTQESSSPVQYSQFIDFLSRLEQNRRTAQVSSIVLQPSTRDRNLLSFTLTVDKYIKP